MSEKLNIGLDLDDVMVNSAKRAIDMYNDSYGSELTIDDWYDFADMDRWKAIDLTQASERVGTIFGSAELADSVESVEGSQASLDELRTRGHRLTIITGRLATAKLLTRQTVDRLFPGVFPADALYLTSHFAKDGSRLNKSQISQRLGLTHYVDDFPVHANDVAAGGVKTALFGEYKWNSQPKIHSGVVRVMDWRQCQDFLDSEG